MKYVENLNLILRALDAGKLHTCNNKVCFPFGDLTILEGTKYLCANENARNELLKQIS